MAGTSFRYQVDSGDRIRFVDAEWLEFARQNAGSMLDRDAVLGRPLWEFIAGEETRQLYSLIFNVARVQMREINVPFRCDSPTCRRYMELAIAPLADGFLNLSGLLIREEPRPYVALLDPSVPRSDVFVRICSWCKRVFIPPNEWAEVELAIRCLNVFASSDLPALTHVMCTACETKWPGSDAA